MTLVSEACRKEQPLVSIPSLVRKFSYSIECFLWRENLGWVKKANCAVLTVAPLNCALVGVGGTRFPFAFFFCLHY